MYPNLAAELARKGLKQKDLLSAFKTKRPAKVSQKLSGKYPLLIDEALSIRSEFFPDLSLDYLFEKKAN